MEGYQRTERLLAEHFNAYPALQIQDVFKFLFQSAFGCEHLVSDEQAALRYIRGEFAAMPQFPRKQDVLDGDYCRMPLTVLHQGLSDTTLARLFCLSAKKEPAGKEMLLQKLAVARDMIKAGKLPMELSEFDQMLEKWRAADFPAVHHSEQFRAQYHPAYRVIANRYVQHFPVFTAIDRLLQKGSAVIAIEGGSASGKSTLADILQAVYDCQVLHTDDFFLRPEQRTPARLAEVGGNLDRERFCDEVLQPLSAGQPIRYRRFDCMTQTLGEPLTVQKGKLTVIEGAYSLHPAFGKYYDLAIFLDISPDLQRKRITVRNAGPFADRFFNEWIPMENAYFLATDVKVRADLHIHIDQ